MTPSAIGPPRRLLAWTLALLCLLGASSVSADPKPVSPDVVKAAFLYRFTNYIEWPGPLGADKAFTIAVLGSDAVAEALVPVLAQHRIFDRPSRVVRISSADSIGDARILFVGAAYVGSLAEVMDAVRGKAVLVVSEREGALQDGSMINFLQVERRIRFEISLTATNAAGLKLGPGLLAVAVNVRGGPRSDLGCLPWNPVPPGPILCPVLVARR